MGEIPDGAGRLSVWASCGFSATLEAMPWDRSRPTPSRRSKGLLSAKDFKEAKTIFRQLRKPCARCNKPIDYDGSYLLPGTRRKNPRYLHVGHKIDRVEAIALGWSDAQINHLSNLQPECSGCSSTSGARSGRARQNALRSIPIINDLDMSREW